MTFLSDMPEQNWYNSLYIQQVTDIALMLTPLSGWLQVASTDYSGSYYQKVYFILYRTFSIFFRITNI